MNTLDAIALGLASFYLAFIVARTHGPFDVFRTIRDRWPLGGLTACVYCLSLWAALSMWLLLQVWPPVVYVFAAAGGASFLYRYTGADVT